ncbi:SDR family oxidoreductase [Nocardiopsis algeriensis]|uniref:NAD(P)-dependent dehydrogenase (Short-subunit alcohol dehydrogenase family) n=1 Tax=Nocardiopsis algeriensis TaxID=1478215 RepID=A0A841IWC3_9ACTN|nr:SDR family oxidoreductase [Nocardiopsis algeriensis]MBB6120815.1 NAD(P)-dependent dehydrogenase (short-subunit alcohol dehydrogenase family) [Nocardiopsis algeriensis]
MTETRAAEVAEETPAAETPGIEPELLRVCLDVLGRAGGLPSDHPDSVALQRATAQLFKSVKEQRRKERRRAAKLHDDAVLAATATAAPDRIDDETRGRALTSGAAGALAGVLTKARPCYVCKEKYREVDAFYHQLCPPCAALNRERRNARTDLTGRRALLTGGRAKIGMYIALRLLRDGAHTTITTRFPNDAVRRFAAMPDSDRWLHRLSVVGIDLRDPSQVLRLADSVAEQGPLDILVNNAAQTVRRSPASYRPLIEAEARPLTGEHLPRPLVLGGVAPRALEEGTDARHALSPEMLASLALATGSASMDRVRAGTAIDAGGLVPDLAPVNSWTQRVGEIDPVEMLEVQLCNVSAPFLLVDRLRPALAASSARRTYIVNVSAMEGVFGRGYKGPGHPHTNMAKAALNMLTRTSAQEMLETDGILMTSVDTGWITDERPHPDKERLAEAGFHAPLDLEDGAARVYDPIVRGERGEDVYGCFLKDYAPAAW